jgi:predicted ATPase/DNA-binding SARP family transcriptional activator
VSTYLRLLGPPTIEWDDRSDELPLGKVVALLVYLAYQDAWVSRDELLALLWPDSDEARARSNLRKLLSRELKRFDFVDEVEVQMQRLRWRVANDHRDFRAALEGGAWSEADRLYRGELLAGARLNGMPEFEGWLELERHNLHQRWREAVVVAADAERERGDYAAAAGRLERLHRADPFDEGGFQRLLVTLQQGGERDRALILYRNFRHRLEVDMGTEPEGATQTLAAEIRDGSAAAVAIADRPTPPARRHNLPVQTTPFVGRVGELAALETQLSDPACRLLTLLAPGGFGKTRLAIEAARMQLDTLRGGVWFLALDAIPTADRVGPGIAAALDLKLPMRRDFEDELIEQLRGRELLLVLDNFEHLIEAGALVARLLEAAPGVKVLTTSREQLNLQSEWIYELGGLGLPEQGEGDSEAIALFVQAARRTRARFVLDDEIRPAVLEIVRRVEGMPLALELAASWLQALSPSEVLAEMERDLDFLESELRDVPERQRSVRAIFDHSWARLAPEAQRALQGLTVFRGGFTRRSAQAVADTSPRTLLSLINSAWLRRDPEGRFQLHELLRQYAQATLTPERLLELRDRHADHYAERLAELDVELRSPTLPRAAAILEAESANIEAAWDHLVAGGRYGLLVRDLLPPLYNQAEARSPAFGFTRLLEQTVAQVPAYAEAGARAILLTAHGGFLESATAARHEPTTMVSLFHREALEEAWVLSRTEGAEPLPAIWRIRLLWALGWMIDHTAWEPRLAALVDELRDGDDDGALASALQALGHLRFRRWTDVDPTPELQEAESLFARLGDRREQGVTLRTLGTVDLMNRRLESARRHMERALAAFEKVRDSAHSTSLHNAMADIAFQIGDREAAFGHLNRMWRHHLERGNPFDAAFILSRESYEALRFSTLEHARARRELSLEVAREAHNDYTELWGRWELGEIERRSGNPVEARRRFEESRTGFEALNDRGGLAFYHRGLATLALEAGQLDEAQQQFERSVELAREIRHLWTLAYAFSGLARVALARGEPEAAGAPLREALAVSIPAADLSIVLVVLAAAAEWRLALGDADGALELTALIVDQPMCWHETREYAERTAEGAAAALSPAEAEAARERGRATDPASAVDLLLQIPT